MKASSIAVAIIAVVFSAGCAITNSAVSARSYDHSYVKDAALFPIKRIANGNDQRYFSNIFEGAGHLSETKSQVEILRVVVSGMNKKIVSAGAKVLRQACGISAGDCDFSSPLVWDKFDEYVYQTEYSAGENLGEYFSSLAQALVEYWNLQSTACSGSKVFCGVSPVVRVESALRFAIARRLNNNVDIDLIVLAVKQ